MGGFFLAESYTGQMWLWKPFMSLNLMDVTGKNSWKVVLTPTLHTASPIRGLLLLTLNMGKLKITHLFYLFSWTMCGNFPFPISGQMAILDRLGADSFHWQGWNGWNQHISYHYYQASVASCPDHWLHQQQDLFCWRSPQFPWVSCVLYCIQTKSDLQTVTDRPALCNT